MTTMAATCPPGVSDVVRPPEGAAGGASSAWVPHGRATRPGPRPSGAPHGTPRGRGAGLQGRGPWQEAPRDEQGNRPRRSSPTTRPDDGHDRPRRRGVGVGDLAGLGVECGRLDRFEDVRVSAVGREGFGRLRAECRGRDAVLFGDRTGFRNDLGCRRIHRGPVGRGDDLRGLALGRRETRRDRRNRCRLRDRRGLLGLRGVGFGNVRGRTDLDERRRLGCRGLGSIRNRIAGRRDILHLGRRRWLGRRWFLGRSRSLDRRGTSIGSCDSTGGVPRCVLRLDRRRALGRGRGLDRGLSLGDRVGPDVLAGADADPGDGSGVGCRFGGRFGRLAGPGSALAGLGDGVRGGVEAEVPRPESSDSPTGPAGTGPASGRRGVRSTRPVRPAVSGLRGRARRAPGPEVSGIVPVAGDGTRGPRGAVRITATSSR